MHSKLQIENVKSAPNAPRLKLEYADLIVAE